MEKGALDKLSGLLKVERFEFTEVDLGENYSGKVLAVFDSDMDRKFRAVDDLIRDLVEYDKQTYSGADAGSPKVTILVPDCKKINFNFQGMVSLLIGKKGR